jgi:phosphoglycerate kinase
MMPKLTINDLDLYRKRVFIRVDFNVPMADGKITDDTRIRASLPTIQYALAHGATAVVASHLGRPKGVNTSPKYSLQPVGERFSELLGRDVIFVDDCVGDKVKAAIEHVYGGGGGVVLLENLRYHPGEEKNDPAFAKALADPIDLYVDDAFGASHRAHASVAAITQFVPRAAAGFLMEEELKYLGGALESPERPFVAILGGAKVSDKLEVIENMLGRVDRLLIGGAMAYTFLKAQGKPIGKSLVEDDKLDAARQTMADAAKKGVRLELPLDHIVTDAVTEGSQHEALDIGDERIGDRYGVDIGPNTIAAYRSFIKDAKTVVWNGPMGVFEIAAYATGTMEVARAVAAVQGTTIVGGGDSIAAVRQAGVADKITHISTGGGASLEFLGGRVLPGVAALSDV